MTKQGCGLYHPPFMSKSVLIHPVDFAKTKQQLQIELALIELDERVGSMLTETGGLCKVRLSGFVDERQRPSLDLTVETQLAVECQRCLKTMHYPLHSRSIIVLCKDEVSLNAVMEEDNDLDAILIESQIDIVQLVEDEIIMGLPFAPKHEHCNSAQKVQDLQTKDNPFAVLSALKKDTSE